MLLKRGITAIPGADDNLREAGLTSLDMVNLMLAIEAEFDIEIPQSAMTPDNFDTIAAMDALVSVTAKGGLMPLDRHARRFLEMLAAAGQSRGRYDDVEERRAALTNLADLVDPPGTEPVGGVRDTLLPVGDGAICLRTYSPLGEPARVLPGILFFSTAAAGWRAAWKPMTGCAAGWPMKAAAG